MSRARASKVADGPSVLIISAAMGAGHDGVAYELERRLHAKGAQAKVYDYLTLLPARSGPFYRSFYAGQLKYAPSSYEWLYGKMDRGFLGPVAIFLGGLGSRKVRKIARDYDVVVSTYPMACQATGKLRAKGKLPIPAVGFLTDVDVHALWLHPGIDMNLTVWHGTATEATERNGVPSHAVGPVLPDTFLTPATACERAEGRALLGLTDEQTMVLVVAGSWGVGDIGRTATAIRDSGAGVPVVLCGRNEDLLHELDDTEGVIALGWTKDVRRLLAASDVLVHNAGGLSCLEGFAVGVPVIGFACLPGHGHRNSLAMQAAGVAADAQTEEQLIAEIRRLAGTAAGAAMALRARELFLIDPTDELLELAQAPVRMPVPTSRSWVTRVAAVTVAVPVTMGALSFGVAQATVHGGLGVAEGKDAVYVAAIVDHSQVVLPSVVTSLRTHQVSAAVRPGSGGPTPTDVRLLLVSGVTVVGTDLGVSSRNPRRQKESLTAAAAAVAATEEKRAKIVCLRTPGVVERVVAWDRDVQLALPDLIIKGGDPLPAMLKAGQQVMLDERGRTEAEIEADFDALSDLVAHQQLPQQPMRALWHQA